MIEEVERLGYRMEALLKRRVDNSHVFSKVACQALEESKIHKRFTIKRFLKSLCNIKKLPGQLSLHGNFGQPPITLYRNNKKGFAIDIYFWVTPDISIHSHGFQGAFSVLHGKSFDCYCEFREKENLKGRGQVRIGDLIPKEAHWLRRGEVREIFPNLIHQVWHIGFPTVSLAVRTLGYQVPQYTYLRPHLAHLSFPPFTPLEIK